MVACGIGHAHTQGVRTLAERCIDGDALGACAPHAVGEVSQSDGVAAHDGGAVGTEQLDHIARAHGHAIKTAQANGWRTGIGAGGAS